MNQFTALQILASLPADHPYREVAEQRYQAGWMLNQRTWSAAESLAIALLAHDPYIDSANVHRRRNVICRWTYELAADDTGLLEVGVALDEWELHRLLPTYVADNAFHPIIAILRELRAAFPDLFPTPPMHQPKVHTTRPATDAEVRFAVEALDGLRPGMHDRTLGAVLAPAGAGLDREDLRHVTGCHVRAFKGRVWVLIDWGAHPREVPVRDEFALPLLRVAERRQEALLVADSTTPCADDAVSALFRTINKRIRFARGKFTVSPGRLQKNWLAAVHRDVPARLLPHLAGVDSLRTVERMMKEHLPPVQVTVDDLLDLGR